MIRNSGLLILSAVAMPQVLLSGCGQTSRAESVPAVSNRPAAARIERVTAGPPVRKTLTRETTQPGWIEAYEQAPLVSKVSGYVSTVPVDIGDRVYKDQTLIEISAPEYVDGVHQKQSHVAQADAELKQAEAAVVAAEAGVRTAQAGLARVQAGVVRAQGEFDRWDAEYNRLRELASRGSVTEKLVDETRNQLRAAEAAKLESQAEIQSAQAAVDEAQAKVGQAEADRGAAAARCNVARANLAYAETMLGYTRMKAPFAGVVTLRQVHPGHFLQPAAGNSISPILAVARTDIVRVFLDVPETEAEYVTNEPQHADPVTVTIQALGGRNFEGTVTRTSWSLDPKNRSLRTEVDLQNPQGIIRPGMYASVRVRLEQRENVLTLPATAIVREGTSTKCCCVHDGKIEVRPVELGLRVNDEYEVISGIKADDIIVLARAAGLQSGQPVEVIVPEKK
jgi:RND family efflux transporter MFP subunit